MFDYYRVRFKEFSTPRRPSDYSLPPDVAPVRMPTSLGVTAVLACALSSIGVFAVYFAGHPALGIFSPLFIALILFLPVTVTLAAGFSEQQAWTRPLLVALFGSAALVSGLCGLHSISGGLCLIGVAIAIYLYRSPGARSYYSYLKQIAVVRISSADLRTLVFVPIYTAAIAIVGALVVTWYVFRRLFSSDFYPGYIGINDVCGAVLVALLLACFLGILGKYVGEAIVSRLSRAA